MFCWNFDEGIWSSSRIFVSIYWAIGLGDHELNPALKPVVPLKYIEYSFGYIIT